MSDRSKSPTADEAAREQAEAVASGKGRATPRRKEREAANRRPLVPADRKAAKAADRARAANERARQQAGLAAGDERFLPARDRGPQRRYARDYVDARWSVGEFLIPIVIVLLLVTFLPFPATIRTWLQVYVLYVVWGFFLLTVIDCIVMGQRLSGKLRAKFGTVERGIRWYVSMRAIQMRRMRLPKALTKRGQFPE